MPVIKKVGLCVALLSLVSMSAIPANNAEQVIFSKTGGLMPLTGNSIAPSTPFGFWIWCAGQAASGSNGGYQNANICQGSMYFYALSKPAMHVVGTVAEGPDGIYTMHVLQGTASNTENPSFSCSLNNITPNGGDSVKVICMFQSALGGGMGTATATGAIVNITGS